MQSADDAEHTKWGGLSPPYLQLGGAEAPPCPPCSYPTASSNPNFTRNFTIDEHYSQPHITPTVTDFLRDFLILHLSFRSWGSNLRYLLELLHLVYLYEYSNWGYQQWRELSKAEKERH